MRRCLPILAPLAFAAATLAQDSSLGSFRDWSAIRFGQGAELACMAFSRPVASTGADAGRGDAFVFVTHRPAADEIDHVSVDAGESYREGAAVQVTVDSLTLTLRTAGSTAWLEDRDETQRLIAAMRAGRELVVTGTSSKGAETLDRYSLYGFSAAHAAIGKACGAG